MAQEVNRFNPRCPPFSCGNLGQVSFPFSNRTHPDCGLLIVDDCNNKTAQKLHFGENVPSFYIFTISQDNSVVLQDHPEPGFITQQGNGSCYESFQNLTLPNSPFLSYKLARNQTLYQCPHNNSIPIGFDLTCNDSKHSFIYPKNGSDDFMRPFQCSRFPFQENRTEKGVSFVNLFTGWFSLQVNATRECSDCFLNGGQCQVNNGSFHCSKATTGDGKQRLTLRLGLVGVGVGGFVLIVLLSICITRHYMKRKYASSLSLYKENIPSGTSQSDLEEGTGSICFEVPIFSYRELVDATNNFNHENELGDGGFGTVYYGKLKDGREVAVKRLHVQNYRRVGQFMNEIHILTRLHHKNLVSLYGCTSRHSPGLLLVYDFIPNGTVADHLHGDRANPTLLTLPIRMKIAIETASALAYLHASDIIHRDVKTNNILLDNNFTVKVADFGLSRLFPNDVTHVSTAPQGSPGYVDPEYHQYYQLTDKSDVYSFGVVLIELISSMAAVDMSRHKHEINLANLAINRIQKGAVDQLIDPCLGYHSDDEVKRMTTSVAELAFICLQQNKEMRPSMDNVLEELKRIKSGECNGEIEVLKIMQKPPSPPDCDEGSLLKNEKWFSSDTTSSASS